MILLVFGVTFWRVGFTFGVAAGGVVPLAGKASILAVSRLATVVALLWKLLVVVAVALVVVAVVVVAVGIVLVGIIVAVMFAVAVVVVSTVVASGCRQICCWPCFFCRSYC